MGKKQETDSDSEYGELTSPVTSEGSNLNVSLSQLTNVNQLLFANSNFVFNCRVSYWIQKFWLEEKSVILILPNDFHD